MIDHILNTGQTDNQLLPPCGERIQRMGACIWQMLSKFLSRIPQGSRGCHFRSREYIDRQRKVNCRMPSRDRPGLHLDSDPCRSQSNAVGRPHPFISPVPPSARAAAVCVRMKRVVEVAWQGGIAATGERHSLVWGRRPTEFTAAFCTPRYA
jgi:hypothetical protein